jgi:DNA polymerase I
VKIVRAWQTKNTISALYFDDKGTLRLKMATGKPVAFFDDVVPKDRFLDQRVVGLEKTGRYWRATFSSGHWDKGRREFVDHREQFCREMVSQGFATYEGDVSVLKRWMIDNNIQIQRPRRVYLDIETDSRVPFVDAIAGHARVLCWALVGPSGEHVSGVLKEDSDEAEYQLLESLVHHLEEYDQIVGWNSDMFDKPVILARIDHLKVPVKDIRRWLWLDQLQVYKRYNISSAESGEDKVSFKLDHVATMLLGEGKHDVDASQSYRYWQDPTLRSTLVKYCVQDTDLLRRIEEKTGYLELHQTVCEACGVQPDSASLKPTVFVDMFMLRLGQANGIRFPTKFYADELESTKYTGAFVMQPTETGIIENVHVCDFASLYPSVMIAWNLSPDAKSPTGTCTSPGTGLRTDATKPGVICTALQALLDLRAHWNQVRASMAPGTPESKDAERRTNAYKMVANSFYGVVGTPYSRYYDRDIVESTTLNGQWLLKQTVMFARQVMPASKTIYGDTDSLFVTGASVQEFDAFVKRCNDELYPRLTAESGCAVNKVKLAYEKAFSRLVFTAAKRYVGKYLHYKGKPARPDSKPEVKGLEIKRGDTSRLARDLQGTIIQMFATGETTVDPYFMAVAEFRQHVLTDDLPLEVIQITKGISRPLEEYKSSGNAPVHVQIARSQLAKGLQITAGTKINYVVLDGSCSPLVAIDASEFTGEFDRHYLWETMVWPPNLRLLTAMFPRFDWNYFDRSRPSKKYNPCQGDLFGAIAK